MARRWAILQVCVLVALVLYGVYASICLGDNRYMQIAVPDDDYFRGIVTRVRNGDNYYDVTAESLPQSRSLFNFRFPTYAWLFALAPNDECIRWTFFGLSLLVALASIQVLLSEHSRWAQALALTWIMGATFAWCSYGDAHLTTEPWVGLLLLASITAYAADRWVLGACLGLSALALRELALPYLFVSAVFAWKEKRWREVVFWGLALTAFVIALQWHAWEVKARAELVESTRLEQWLRMPGYPFVLETARMCIFLWLLPVWVSALVIPFSWLGLWAWKTPAGRRMGATVCCFSVAFLVVRGGGYWGLMYCPMLGFGLANIPAGIRELVHAIMPRPNLDAANTAAPPTAERSETEVRGASE